MISPEESTWSFLIRIWLEESGEAGQIRWRGHITNIPSNQRRHFDDLEEMKLFVMTYLDRWNNKVQVRDE